MITWKMTLKIYLNPTLTKMSKLLVISFYNRNYIIKVENTYCLCSKEWMFFDVSKINVKGGDGGDGCMAMRREFRIAFGGPSGGNGGNGGSVYLRCDKQLNTLGMLRRRVHHRALDGTNGKGDSRHGKAALDVVVPVPPGMSVLHCYCVIQ